MAQGGALEAQAQLRNNAYGTNNGGLVHLHGFNLQISMLETYFVKLDAMKTTS